MKVKFCGLKKQSEVEFASEMGCFAVGFVLVPGSRREVDLMQAKNLTKFAQSLDLTSVILVADADTGYVDKIIQSCEPDIIQFHGQESAEFCHQFDYPYWKAVPMLTVDNWLNYVAQYKSANHLLLDAYGGKQSGGSGQVFDWFRVPSKLRKKLILAGGLTVSNVAQAVSKTGIEFIDVSSGIEQTPGVKSQVLMQRFMHALTKNTKKYDPKI
ncbi:phosphoribosylanthranilate isomerase [Marinicella gelatinilytica]|uniref:phosphoribosylanthranilate isomerase n=1 Tax=Marinicella gelatinilytica TaxID=2996017 RepID=UPI002260E2AD|nr:phosphoribosylanthranilate isomerase [Marinicella gelatinilytica]MCX7546047.1 phosphoribosylanthranilate isomerase [Marinicella gelatinilytica]